MELYVKEADTCDDDGENYILIQQKTMMRSNEQTKP